MAPSKKVVESECETCQCLNNEYICANTCSPPIDPPVPASKCNPDAPIIEHFSECEIYRVCDDVVNDTRHYKDYECGPDDLFNPILLACSPLDDVYKVKPECKKVHKNITALKPVKYGEKSYRPTPPALCKTG